MAHGVWRGSGLWQVEQRRQCLRACTLRALYNQLDRLKQAVYRL